MVKCFNIVNHSRTVHPRLRDGVPDMLLCGYDAAAKRTVARLHQEFGWGAPMDVGGIDGARWLEA